MSGWTRFPELCDRLRGRWESGRLLKEWASGQPWSDIALSIKGPSASDLVERFDKVKSWRAEWLSQQHRIGVFTVEMRAVGARSIGGNEIPARMVIRSWDDLWRLLGVTGKVARYSELRLMTVQTEPRLGDWVIAKPLVLLANEPSWPAILATLEWLRLHRNTGSYLRQIPIPGIDTKFIEANRALLADLLDQLVDVADDTPRSQFARRYGFATPPALLRFRLLAPAAQPLTGLTELAVRVEEFDAVAPDFGTVFIVENEITYLAFPAVADAVIIFGSGYALSAVAAHRWFRDRRIRYWGDIDTHGFAILNNLRRLQPHTESMLMDRETLTSHRDQWVTEETPSRQALPHLSAAESALHCDLVEATFGPAVRLEQERVGFSHVRDAVSADGRGKRARGPGPRPSY